MKELFAGREGRMFLAAMAALVLLPALFPGDVQWVNDEPLLIGNALTANREGHPVVMGLMGTRGVAYGPLPTWLYQAYLAVSHDLVALVSVRALFCGGLMAFAFLWLARSLGLWRWYAAVMLCSPYLAYYARTLWDNSFNLPFGALALASYADFLGTKRTRSLLLTLGSLWAMLMVHLMSLAFVVPFVAHLLWFGRKELWAKKGPVLALSAGLVAASFSYGKYLLSAHSTAGDRAPTFKAFLFPLWGAQHVSAWNMQQLFNADWLLSDKGALPQLVSALQDISGLGLLFGVGGMVVAGREALRAWKANDATPRTHLGVVCLGVAICHSGLSALTDRHSGPHYLNATAMAYAVLTWLCVDALAKKPPLQWVAAVQGVCMLIVTLYIGGRLHSIGGGRDSYGATLENQLQIASGLVGHAPNVRAEVLQVHRFPHALPVLMQVAKPSGAPADQPLRLTYASADPFSGQMALIPLNLP